jgi:hypothetical protein
MKRPFDTPTKDRGRVNDHSVVYYDTGVKVRRVYRIQQTTEARLVVRLTSSYHLFSPVKGWVRAMDNYNRQPS